MKKYRIDEITENLDNLRKPLNSIQRSRISQKKLYPYYGANSLIDYVDEYIFDEEILCVAEDGGSWGYKEKCTYIVNEKCWVNNHAHVLRAKDNLNIAYLSYYLNYNDLNSHITGTTRGKLTKSALSNIEILLPELEKQNIIVEILDKAQQLIDKRKKQIESLDELVKSQFIEMFGDKDKYTYIKIEQLVSNKSDIVDGPFGSNLKTVDYVDDGVRVIQINNIGESNFRDKNKKYITEEKYKSLLKHSVVPGDIVVAKMGEPIGRACILPDYISKAVIVADCMKIRPNLAIINRKYLEFLLNTEEVKAQFRKYSQGSTRVRLNLTMLRQIKVLYPPIELQNQFADFVKQVDKLKFEMEKSLKELEDNFNALMQKAFNGELFN